MAALSYFVILSSPSFGKVSAFRLPSVNTDQIILHRHRQPAISACSIKKPRGNRKVRSNADLCNDLREFVSAVELPEGHVPSLKELSQHGRQDLANIVRRRGYKLIKELLATSTKYDREESDIEEGLMDKQATLGGCGNESIGQDNKVKDIANDNFWSSEASGTQNILKIVNGADIDHNKSLDSTSCMPIATSISSSLQEKVAKFIQSGELDAIEDDGFGILNEIGAEEGKEIVQLQKIENKSSSLGRELSEKVFGRSDEKLNGSISPSKEVVLRASGFNTPRDDGLSIAGLLRSDCEEEMNDEIRKRENQIEVNHLKFMLHQKELELSRLKEQIEKEKLALSVLQTKAETEISKAQKLILEKDAELYAAEESLSGLKEVQIQYRGDCETVEVAGSFNGWHHRITMDPQPSSSILEDPTGSRKSRLWTTVLWLYPGIYEIKFVVDGCWRVDPKRELVTSGTIQNNILRVDR